MPNGSLPDLDNHMQWQRLTNDDLVADGAGEDPSPNDLGDGTRYTGYSGEMG